MDEHNVETYDIYLLVRNQVRLSPMGEIIGLDYNAVLNVIKLYIKDDNVKMIFENVLNCFQIEQEFNKK